MERDVYCVCFLKTHHFDVGFERKTWDDSHSIVGNTAKVDRERGLKSRVPEIMGNLFRRKLDCLQSPFSLKIRRVFIP